MYQFNSVTVHKYKKPEEGAQTSTQVYYSNVISLAFCGMKARYDRHKSCRRYLVTGGKEEKGEKGHLWRSSKEQVGFYLGEGVEGGGGVFVGNRAWIVK